VQREGINLFPLSSTPYSPSFLRGTMSKSEVKQRLATSWELSEVVQKLQRVVVRIETSNVGTEARELLYELVEVVLECGERVRDLETKIASGEPMEENQRREERLRVEVQMARRIKKGTTNPDDVKNQEE
jgi:hypothetical protein